MVEAGLGVTIIPLLSVAEGKSLKGQMHSDK